MLHQAPFAVHGAPYVIVLGNEKGGAGKTTLAMHVAIALMKDGQRVGTIDLDGNQKSLTRYIENRRAWANYRRLNLPIPAHRYIARAEGRKPEDNETEELAEFEAAVSGFEQSVEFLVIDTPAADTYLMRLAHLLADTVITPLNDSFLDLSTLASIDPVTREITGHGHYPPAAVFFYSPDRTAKHPEQHLAGYTGLMQADAYAGFNRLYDARRLTDIYRKRISGDIS